MCDFPSHLEEQKNKKNIIITKLAKEERKGMREKKDRWEVIKLSFPRDRFEVSFEFVTLFQPKWAQTNLNIRNIIANHLLIQIVFL